jgi:hypothetical protein
MNLVGRYFTFRYAGWWFYFSPADWCVRLR